MARHNDHSACVDAWIGPATAGLSSSTVVDALDRAFGALWRRAHRTLGDVTLTAITERVLHDATLRYASFSALRVGPDGLECGELRERAGSLDPVTLTAGVRFVLVELLSVLGNLTANVLTAALHDELTKVALAEPRERGEAEPTVPVRGHQGEGSEP